MIDDVFAVIADPTRRQLLRSLSAGRRSVGELVDELGISQPTVSKHLKVLRESGLAHTEAQGQRRYYSLTPEPLQKVSLWIEALYTAFSENEGTSDEVEDAKKNLDSAEPQKPENPVTVADTVIVSEGSDEKEDPVQEETAETEPAVEPVESVEENKAEQHAVTFTPLKPFKPSEPSQPSEAEKAEEQAEEVREPEAVGADEQAVEELEIPPALPTATYSEDAEGESKGLFATLSRWGRRRR